MSEDWCHDTSASNVYIVAWQKIVKPKALELGVIVCTRYCEMEWSGWPGIMCRTCFSPFKPCLKLREAQYLCCENAFMSKVLTVAGWKTDECISRKLPLPPFASATTFWIPFFLSATSEFCQTAQHQVGLWTWRHWTLQSDWHALYSPHRTRYCMAVLPDSFSIFPKGVWAQDYILWWFNVAPSVQKVDIRGLCLMKTLTALPCNVCPRTWDSRQCQYGSLFSIRGTN